ncbi:MAG TPA: ASKHA domain-containing protein [Syntrophomonadaceae bacterium]|nr:ASKHA domain-containing protein [Syntrophomonadaceae bacterium]HQE23364.1 ASKHA domain-containing protein [Syntrophomonadaceae bacterium]
MSDPVKIQVNTTDGKQRVLWTLPGKSLWEVLTEGGYHPGGTCGGHGICGKCRVKATGDISPMDEIEQNWLLPGEINRGERVACRCIVWGSAEVYLPDEMYTPKHGLDPGTKMGLGRATCRRVLLPGLDPQEPVPVYQRLKNALGMDDLMLPVDTLQELSRMDRIGRPSLEVNALVLDGTIWRVSREYPKAYGLALDVGTTSLWAGLIDLESGETVAISSQLNMQRVYGADIISRVSYCLEHFNGPDELHQVLINNINAMIEDLLDRTGAFPEDIYETVVVGNPVMIHFFLGLPTTGFASHPYQGLFVDQLTVAPASLNLQVNRSGKVIILPQVNGFVGADTISCLLNIADWDKSSFILLDIGTNGEVVVGNQGKLWATSAAAGPALEGGHIRCGMRASEGAIDRVVFSEEDGWHYRVIGGGYPRGICGSGVIDLTAALLKSGWIDKYGTIIDKGDDRTIAVQMGSDGAELVLRDPDGNWPAPIIFSQEDIRKVQLAKAALRTAVDLLMEKAGLRADNIQHIYLAGAFGNFLDAVNLVALGLLPQVKLDIILPIGNAAASGAVAALVSLAKRQEASRIQGGINYVELANLANFQSRFLEQMNF